MKIPLPYLLEDLESAGGPSDLKFNDRREYKFGSTLCGAQENLSRKICVSVQKVWARELRRKMMKKYLVLLLRGKRSS